MNETLFRSIAKLIATQQKSHKKMLKEDEIFELISNDRTVLSALQATSAPQVVEHRPDVLDCDVVRFQNNKEKWVALVLLKGCSKN